MSVRDAVVARVPRRLLVAIDRHPRVKRVLRTLGERGGRSGGGLREVVLPTGPLAGTTMTLDFSTDEKRLHAGAYEPWVHDVLRRNLGAEDLLWDVGAHIGYYVLWAATVSPRRHVALEPDPATLERLRGHLHGADVEVLPVAAGASPGTARFDSSATQSLVSRMSDTGSVEVPVVTLDSLLEGREPPTLVLMDIEGFEADALAGAPRLLHEVRPAWLVELHGGGGLRAYEALRAAGYDVRTSNTKTPVAEQLRIQPRIHAYAAPGRQ